VYSVVWRNMSHDIVDMSLEQCRPKLFCEVIRTKRVNSRLTLNFLHEITGSTAAAATILHNTQQQQLPLLILTILLLVIFMLLLSSPAPVLSFFMVCPTPTFLAKQKEFLCCSCRSWTLVLPHIHNVLLSTPHPR